MNGNIPNILIILLAVVTYGSLAFVIMRFALRESRPEARITGRTRPRAIPVPVERAESVLAALQREALEPPREMKRTPVPRPSSPPAQDRVESS